MKDYVGQWFEIYRRHSEPADILFEIKDSQKTEWVAFPHEKADGSGALFSIAQEKNWTVRSSTAKSERHTISFWLYFKNIVLFLYWTNPLKRRIWPFHFQKTKHSKTLQASLHFSPAKLEDLKVAAQDQKISLNTFLLYHLHQTLEARLNFISSKKSWWIPVDMRPELGLDPNDPSLKKNYVSNFSIELKKEYSPQDVQKIMSNSLKKKKYWGTWWWQHLGKFLPDSAVEKIALSNLRKNNYIGAFTNLGEWTCSTDNHVTVFANAILSHPIGAAAIVWNGHLNLSLRIYPTFPLKEVELKKLLIEWQHRLTSSLIGP